MLGLGTEKVPPRVHDESSKKYQVNFFITSIGAWTTVGIKMFEGLAIVGITRAPLFIY